MNKRIEFLEERAAGSSSTTSREISEFKEEVQQLQEALLAEKSQCGHYRRDVEDARRALVEAEQFKLVTASAQQQPWVPALFIMSVTIAFSSGY